MPVGNFCKLTLQHDTFSETKHKLQSKITVCITSHGLFFFVCSPSQTFQSPLDCSTVTFLVKYTPSLHDIQKLAERDYTILLIVLQ